MDSIKNVLANFSGVFHSVVDIPLLDKKTKAHLFNFENLADFYLIDSGYFPLIPPFLIINWKDDNPPEVVQLDWDSSLPESSRLIHSLSQLVSKQADRKIVFGKNIHSASSSKSSQKAGDRRFLRSSGFAERSDIVDIYARIPTFVREPLNNARIMIVGLGSVGSRLAEQLCRNGVTNFILIDSDNIEAPNLSRTIFFCHEIGKSKVDSVKDHLEQINGNASVVTISNAIQSVEPNQLKELFLSSDLVIAATDDPSAQLLINRCCNYTDRPSIYIGLYKGAKAGEIISVIPKIMPCLNCIVGSLRSRLSTNFGNERSVDYGSGRLTGEIALGSDIHFVTDASVKIIIGLLVLLKGQQGNELADFSLTQLQKQLSMVILSMEKNYWFFPSLFGDVAGQYAFQSAWFRGEKLSNCHVCSDTAEKIDPFDQLNSNVSIDELRGYLEE